MSGIEEIELMKEARIEIDKLLSIIERQEKRIRELDLKIASLILELEQRELDNSGLRKRIKEQDEMIITLSSAIDSIHKKITKM